MNVIEWDDCDDEPRGERCWTVQAKLPTGEWSEWTAWVDRATAEAELVSARADGHRARIVRAA